jgi:deoxyadenosine/deoxycytidine kinase
LYNYIAFEGVIGAGKTTFAKAIASQLHTRLLLEEFEDNPFLESFYQDKDKFSFPAELSFLASRYHQLKDSSIKNDLFQEKIISDFVFYKSLVFASINLKGDEMMLYRRLFDIMFSQIPKPDLTIYVQLSIEKVLRNIAKRGRTYEQSIDAMYLEQIHHNYIQYFNQLQHHRIVILHSEELDIYENKNTLPILEEILKTPFPEGISYI